MLHAVDTDPVGRRAVEGAAMGLLHGHPTRRGRLHGRAGRLPARLRRAGAVRRTRPVRRETRGRCARPRLRLIAVARRRRGVLLMLPDRRRVLRMRLMRRCGRHRRRRGQRDAGRRGGGRPLLRDGGRVVGRLGAPWRRRRTEPRCGGGLSVAVLGRGGPGIGLLGGGSLDVRRRCGGALSGRGLSGRSLSGGSLSGGSRGSRGVERTGRGEPVTAARGIGLRRRARSRTVLW
ncbi:hypothetical protein AHOG_08670 [Actinoalloteichus hoggarensis]|uniref:Uncharacterized protein n=1 Tax=Actinoalloteichus hoggarensis TaxID=1470176 RepID=A0A221W0Y9_9PSEU|nr:hypothetical protein AHOG_08670 [Actinoalloteichus hoggarensis]